MRALRFTGFNITRLGLTLGELCPVYKLQPQEHTFLVCSINMCSPARLYDRGAFW